MLPELKTLLSYKNEAVLQRYAQDFPRSTLSANRAFKELMKFMWLSLKAQADKTKFKCVMHHEMLEIDNMWHTFLLFTRDYHQFCEKYIGQFFHHNPHSRDETEPTDKQFEKDLTAYLSYIYDNLGAKTLKVWFEKK